MRPDVNPAVTSSTAALGLFVVGPHIAWLGLLSLQWGAFQRLRQEAVSQGLAPPETGRFAIVTGYSATPALLGILVWNRQPIAAAPALELLLLWSGIAYLAASCSMVVSQEFLLRPRFSAIFSPEMGRVLVLPVIPMTGVVFALVLNLQILGAVDAVVNRGSPLTADAVDSTVRALGAFSLGTLGFLVAAIVSKGIRDLSGRGFIRAILLLEAGELPVLLGLVMAISAIGSL